ncbi:MAG: ABC transporter ATP-binding protein [Waddliaceae bacterium]
MEKSLFYNLRRILIQYRAPFFRAVLMMALANALLVANSLIFRQAVAQFDPSAASPFSYQLANSLSLWVLAMLIVAIASALLKYYMRIAFLYVSREEEKQIRGILFDRIQKQSMAFFDRHGVGDLLSRLTNDVSVYREVLGPGLMYPLFFVTLVVPGMMALFWISAPLATVALLPLFLIPVVNLLTRKRLYDMSLYVQNLLGELSNMVQEHFSSIRVIKAYATEEPLYNKFSKKSEDLASQQFWLMGLQGTLFPFLAFLTKLTTAVLVLMAAYANFRAWETLSTADFLTFMWIQSYIFLPVLMLGWVIPVYQRGRAAYQRLYDLFEEPIEVQDLSQKELHIKGSSSIEIKNLNFTYPTRHTPVLVDLNLSIEGGSFVGITGPVGSGKSTLFRLLMREYEVSHGMIEIGGNEIHEYPLSAFREAIVTVEQIPFIFSRTIEENIRFGNEKATTAEIETVLNLADLHETVLDFPFQYQTVVGERGVTLSGGQIQRLAMARAFLVDRSILLLDDVFSAVDSKTEQKIFSAIKRNFIGKTVLIITHRLSVLEQMDRIVYMLDGRVVESGSPQELNKRNGHYRAMIDLHEMGIEP